MILLVITLVLLLTLPPYTRAPADTHADVHSCAFWARCIAGLVLAALGLYLWVSQEGGGSSGSTVACTLPMSAECAAGFTGTAIAGFPARRVLVFLYAAVFTWRVMVQMLYFWAGETARICSEVADGLLRPAF